MKQKSNSYISYFLYVLICLTSILISQSVWSLPKRSPNICRVTEYISHLQSKSSFLANFKLLIKQQSNLNEIDCHGKSLFGLAYRIKPLGYLTDVRPRRYDELELLLKYGYNPNNPNKFGYTPLHDAAIRGDINLIYLLVEKGADINALNKKGETPLHLAIYYSSQINTQAINLLLHLEANPNVPNQNNKTPLEYAFDAYSPKIVELLLQHGAQSSDKMLEYAKSKSYKEQFQQIVLLFKKYQQLRTEKVLQNADSIKLSFDPPPPPSRQLLPGLENSLLIEAIRRNDKDEVKKLIVQEEDLNARDVLGLTALNTAMSRSSEEIVKLLIEAGANVNIQDLTGIHPLYKASENYKLTKMLLDNGAIVDKKTAQNQYTALINSNNSQVSKLLLEHGADINHQSEDGITPLFQAIDRKNVPLVKFLLEYGADANIVNRGNQTPLFFAIKSNQLEIVKLLLDYVCNEQKNKAYDWAVLNHDYELENILSKSRADYFDK